MGRISIVVVLLGFICVVTMAGNTGRSSAYGYNRQPPVMTANGSYKNSNRSGYSTTVGDDATPSDPVKGASQEKKSAGFRLSAWGIIAMIVIGSLFLTALYYLIILYPLFCKQERDYDVMEIGSQ